MHKTILAVFALLAFAPAASATPVTLAFEGVITFLEDDYGDLGGAQVGDSFSGTYTYDDATTAVSSSSNRADYAMPMEFEVSIGSALIAPGPLDDGALVRVDGPYLSGGFGGPLFQVDEDRYFVRVREVSNVMDLLLDLEQGPAGALVVASPSRATCPTRPWPTSRTTSAW